MPKWSLSLESQVPVGTILKKSDEFLCSPDLIAGMKAWRVALGEPMKGLLIELWRVPEAIF